jgi:DNA-binding transcriptional ArsR family regulator
MKRVESEVDIIAEPNRRVILSLLVSSQQSVGAIERQLRMLQTTVSKHLRVRSKTDFVGILSAFSPHRNSRNPILSVVASVP